MINPQFGDIIGPWHRWFAWHPVSTYDCRWLWLRFVNRVCVQKHDYLSGGGPYFWFIYSIEEQENERS